MACICDSYAYELASNIIKEKVFTILVFNGIDIP